MRRLQAKYCLFLVFTALQMKQIEAGSGKGQAWKKGSASQLQRDRANNRKKVVIVFFAVSITQNAIEY